MPLDEVNYKSDLPIKILAALVENKLHLAPKDRSDDPKESFDFSPAFPSKKQDLQTIGGAKFIITPIWITKIMVRHLGIFGDLHCKHVGLYCHLGSTRVLQRQEYPFWTKSFRHFARRANPLRFGSIRQCFDFLTLIYSRVAQVEAWEGLTGSSLPLSRKGLSSSAAICVLIVRSLNKLYVPRQSVKVNPLYKSEGKLELLQAQLAHRKLKATRFYNRKALQS